MATTSRTAIISHHADRTSWVLARIFSSQRVARASRVLPSCRTGADRAHVLLRLAIRRPTPPVNVGRPESGPSCRKPPLTRTVQLVFLGSSKPSAAMVQTMRIMSIVGARPQFVKLAAVDPSIRKRGHEHVIVHTGQHYDPALSEAIFEDLKIPAPHENLEVGSLSHGAQTAAMLEQIEDCILRLAPDFVLVFGDTNSTLAAAVAGAKLPTAVAHVEAGLRSFNRKMPEETNRVLTDHCSDLLLTPTPTASSHLEREGLSNRVRFTGDVMYDVYHQAVQVAPASVAAVQETVGPGGYYLATIHREENTDDPDRLEGIIRALRNLDLPTVLPVHPRLRARAQTLGIDLGHGALRPIPPLRYLEMLTAVRMSSAVLTDSGGLQKEAFFAAKPCTTIRTETEWPETLTQGWNQLAEPDAVLDAVRRPRPLGEPPALFGDGSAGKATVVALEEYLDRQA